MGVEHRNSRRRNLARQTEVMVKPKRPLRADGRNASVWRLSVLVLVPLILFVAALVLLGYNWNIRSALPQDALDKKFRVFGYKIIKEYPHDPDAFTQGLFYDGNDTFYESTGLNGKSSVRKVDVKTGKHYNLIVDLKAGAAKQKIGPVSLWGGFDPLGFKVLVPIDSKLSGIFRHQMYVEEDVTRVYAEAFVYAPTLLQVTWLSKKGYIYDKSSLSLVGSFKHPMQDGWGLTSGKDHIVGSDGTANVYFMDPSTFREVRKVLVKDDGQPVPNLNELEYIKDEIWANVYQTECIARIAPQDGKVTGWLLMHGLRSALSAQGVRGMDVLNGIAWDSERDRLFVTGKLWPKVYEIELVDQTSHYRDLRVVQKMCIREQMVWPGVV